MTWSSLEELEAAVAAYQSSWWREDDDALAVINDRAHPALRPHVLATSALGQVVTTADIYRPYSPGVTGDRPYLRDRTAVHAGIIADCVPDDVTPPGNGPPSAFFTIGCPGAGKTTVLRSIVQSFRRRRDAPSDPHPISVIDADRVRQALPEYSAGLGAFVVEPECYDLTYGPVFERALARGGDIVYDTIGRMSSMRDYLDALHVGGYDIHVLHARAPVHMCQQRTEQRALRIDGRVVNPAMLERAANASAEVIGALLGERFPLAGWADIDTSDMENPTVLDAHPDWTGLL